MINKFIADRKIRGLSQKTILYYSENLLQYKKYCENNNIELLSEQSYNSYCLNLLENTNINRVTVCTYLRAVKTFLRWCTDNGYCDFGYKIKLPKKSGSKIIPLSDNEIFLIMHCLDDTDILHLRNKCIVLLMLDCGLRRGEVVDLKCSNVNFSEKSLVVVGKGDKQRYVPMGDNICKYMSVYNDLVSRSDMRHFFVNKSGNKITGNVIRCFFQKLKKQSGVMRLHPHLLRHTFATRYLLNGGNLESLRLILGHSDLDITQVYLHLAEYFKILQSRHISLVDKFTE